MKLKLVIVGILISLTGYSTLSVLTVNQKLDLSDEFSDSKSLKNWKRFYEEEKWPDMMKSIEIEDGMLVMEPNTSGWYADYHAPFIFKELTGNFTVTTRLKISGLNSEVPKATWSLSGIMIRAPRDITPKSWTPNGENWMFLTTGFARDLVQPVFETKTTVNSKSKLKLHPNKLDWVSLKADRKGGVFTLSYRYNEKDQWTVIETFVRNDLPKTLQVGLCSYTDFYSAGKELMDDYYKYNTTVVNYGSPDLRVKVDFFRVE
ncbi:hypothetical protein [Winogradskyella sp.]|uniref:hypothetical protein n=1 Tax=Winogradskyella sp. TaxID=1883156 RepID=UPI0026301054|nr:hypothetical protein [Winogradskyella sp.]